MKTEWLMAVVTAFGTPTRAKNEVFLVIFDILLADPGPFCGQGATWCPENHILGPKNITSDHVIKIECLVTNLTAVRSPVSAESEGFWVIFDFFWPIWAAFVVWEPLCDLESPPGP